MASYVPFFDPDFTGLTHQVDNNHHRPFEQSLGIVAQPLPLEGTDIKPADDEYQIVRSAKLFLLNPQGALQAILEPDDDFYGEHIFTSATITRD